MSTSIQAGPSRMQGQVSTAGWDEQVVPALRKRLESESAYLSHRMSGASFPEINHQSSLSPFPPALSDHAPRTRTKSTMTRSPSKPSGISSEVSPPVPRSEPRPSRIPMRPRSKSNLAPRPSPADIAPPSEEPVPALSTLPRSRSGRGSPDPIPLMSIDEGFLKNELPPFKLRSDEAMRIAQRGHDLDSEEEDQAAVAAEVYKRKRRETMRATDGDKRTSRNRPTTGASPSSSSGMSRSATGDVNLGLGIPSSRLSSSQSPRISSARQARNNHLASPPSASTPRSASLNMLASQAGNSPGSSSSARLGVAAHFVPPESTYTPPKGQNWDEVVLPTVAKKLELNESTSTTAGVTTTEGDLAVEWDKNGTPVKWIKKESVHRVGGASEASRLMRGNSGLTRDDFITRDPSPSLTPNKSGHSFSPTFEPSPDNPLASPTHLTVKPRPSQSSLGTPIRTSSGQYTPLGRSSPPPSPAPSSQMQPNPNQRPRAVPSQSSLGRKGSMLRRASPARTPVEEDMRTGQRGGAGDRFFTNPRPAPVAQNGSVYYGQQPQSTRISHDSPAGVRGGRKDEHSKGCGCTIM